MGVFPAIFSHAGGAQFFPHARKGIRFARKGCTNRPFYHIVVNHLKRRQSEQPIEQLGSYDPMPNHKGELLVALNVERLQYWIGEGAEISTPCAELLGLAGILPVHPYTYLKSWRARKVLLENLQQQQLSADQSKESNKSS